MTCFVHYLHRKWSQGNWLLTLFFFQQQFWVSLMPAFVLYSVEILPRWNGSDFSIGLASASESTAVQKWMHLVIFITAVFNLNSKLTALKLVIPPQTWRVFLELWISENGRKWSVGLCLEITALTLFLALSGFGSLLLNSVSHFAQIVDLSSEVFKLVIKISVWIRYLWYFPPALSVMVMQLGQLK